MKHRREFAFLTSLACIFLTCGELEEVQEQIAKAKEFRAAEDLDDLTSRLCLLDENCTRGSFQFDTHIWILLSQDFNHNEEQSIRAAITAWQRVLPQWMPCVGRRHVSDEILIEQSLTFNRTHIFLKDGAVITAVFYWSETQHAVAHIDPRIAYPATNLREVVAHEIGHALGLGDIEGETESIMRWPVSDGDPTQEDALAVCDLHPELACE